MENGKERVPENQGHLEARNSQEMMSGNLENDNEVEEIKD